jgi:predicted enzyme related to lactoylglutathione lyase
MEILSSRILLSPCDFDVSRRFYEETVGLAVFREFPGGVVFFLGGGFLELSRRGVPVTDDKVAVYLQVRDVDAAFATLAGSATVVEPPVAQSWGLREARVRDPDGLLLVFVEVPPGHPQRTDTR